MDNADQHDISQWVMRQTATLTPPPGWQPDAETARLRFEARRRAKAEPTRLWHRWPVWAAVAASIAVAAALFPGTRVAAQRLWQLLTVGRVAVIEVKPWPDGVPSPAVHTLGRVFPPIPARDVEDCLRRVHYLPRLPITFDLPGTPRLSTAFSVAAGTTIKVADLQLALRKSGVPGALVPPDWDGAQVSLHTSDLVIAEWPEVVLVQSLPLTLSAPGNFDFARCSATILQVLGVSPDDAQRLAQLDGTAPLWLLPLPRDSSGLRRMARIQEVTLNSGRATFVEERDSPRVALLWSVSDRIYLLNGKISRDVAIAVANSVR